MTIGYIPLQNAVYRVTVSPECCTGEGGAAGAAHEKGVGHPHPFQCIPGPRGGGI